MQVGPDGFLGRRRRQQPQRRDASLRGGGCGGRGSNAPVVGAAGGSVWRGVAAAAAGVQEAEKEAAAQDHLHFVPGKEPTLLSFDHLIPLASGSQDCESMLFVYILYPF